MQTAEGWLASLTRGFPALNHLNWRSGGAAENQIEYEKVLRHPQRNGTSKTDASLRMNDANSQKMLGKAAMDEEVEHSLALMKGTKYLEIGYQQTVIDEKMNI